MKNNAWINSKRRKPIEGTEVLGAEWDEVCKWFIYRIVTWHKSDGWSEVDVCMSDHLDIRYWQELPELPLR